MTALWWPDHVLTLDEWDSLPEYRFRRCELVEGVVSMVPRPMPAHQLAVIQLAGDLNTQIPGQLTAVQDVEVVIDRRFPATVRAPDVVVIPTSLYEENPPRFEAADLVLAVEIVSPGTKRIDRITKPAEYADAGISNYWVIDLDAPATLTAYSLVDGEYELVGEGSGVLSLSSPAPVIIDVSTLSQRRRSLS